MSKLDRIGHDIGCLAIDKLPAELISTTGYHCDVWQTARKYLRNNKTITTQRIIKLHRDPLNFREIRTQYRNYRELRDNLGSIIPKASFIATAIDGKPNVIVVAEVVRRWFNLANPSNESEAVPLLRGLPIAKAQLHTFVEVAREWYQAREMRVIDLWGVDNLVLDRDRRVRYVDSFRVFFYADTLHVLGHIDDDLAQRIEVSLKRLEYLEHLVHEIGGGRFHKTSSRWWD